MVTSAILKWTVAFQFILKYFQPRNAIEFGKTFV